MRKILVLGILVMMLAVFGSKAALADSLSAALGATKMDGLTNFANCQDETIGYREKLIADRLELKVANTPRRTFVPLNPRDPQHYLLGLTDREQVAINSLNNCFIQEIRLKCEQKYGGMSRYSSNTGETSEGQLQYENQLRAEMTLPLNLAAIPVEPLPIPKSPAQAAQEKRAAVAAVKQADMQAAWVSAGINPITDARGDITKTKARPPRGAPSGTES